MKSIAVVVPPRDRRPYSSVVCTCSALSGPRAAGDRWLFATRASGRVATTEVGVSARAGDAPRAAARADRTQQGAAAAGVARDRGSCDGAAAHGDAVDRARRQGAR